VGSRATDIHQCSAVSIAVPAAN
jgi:hypothetical protein